MRIKMSKNLETLAKPFKYVDGQILRQYSKLTKKWEDRGHSRYSLSMIPSIIGGSIVISLSSLSNPLVALLGGLDLGKNYVGFFFGESAERGYEQNEERIQINNPIGYAITKLHRMARTPMFLTGAFFTGKGILDFYDYFVNRNDVSLMEGFKNLSFGVSNLGFSSSMYIRDSDPKLLDKAPFWKTAYDWATDKIKPLVPQPQPIPETKPA